MKLPERFPENAQGDFYVMNDACITCGAPEAEAPDLIDHSKKDLYGHCYFKKQPQTPDELDRAINALQVSCIAGLRYGGKEEAILKRLYEMGLASLCDHRPVGGFKSEVQISNPEQNKDTEMNFSQTLKREFEVAFSKNAQPVWFRIVKYIVLGAIIYFFWGTNWLWIILVAVCVLGLSLHFWYRYKTRGWTKSYGAWDYEKNIPRTKTKY